MRQNLVFVMSLSGTTVYLLYLLIYFFAKKYFTAQWRYRILKISLAFFLIPLPYYKPMMNSFIRAVFPFISSEINWNDRLITTGNNYIVQYNNAFFFSEQVLKIWLASLVSGAIFLTIIIVQLTLYIKTKRTCLNHGTCLPPAFLLDRLMAMKTAMGIKINVTFILSKYIHQPIVIGVFRPVIIFPFLEDEQLMRQEWDYAIKHELAHIKRRDLLIRFVALFVMAVHWFNPVCYFLLRELNSISEICCDDFVMKNEDSRAKKEYCHFIVNLASENKFSKISVFSVGTINHNRKTISRRILEMSKINKAGKKALSYFICGLICVMGVVTAFAYDEPLIMEITGNEDFTFDVKSTYLATIGDVDDFGKMPYDSFFIDENENIIEIPEIEAKAKAHCEHIFKAGTFTKHESRSDGGCRVLYYHAKLCTKCNYVSLGELNNMQTNMPCPH